MVVSWDGGPVEAIAGLEAVDFAGTDTGTWIPTCTAIECCAAAAWRPVTKGELATGRARERDSWADVPM